MYIVLFFWLITIVFSLLFGLVMDVGKTLITQVYIQGGMDAATLAGTSQQDEVASQTAPNGAPTKFAC